MESSLPSQPAARTALTTIKAQTGLRGRELELRLLLWQFPLLVLAAAGLQEATGHADPSFVPFLATLAIPWAACVLLHLLLCAVKFDGDLLLLPLLSLLLLLGGAYHLGLPASSRVPENLTPYARGALIGLGTLALVTAGSRWLRRANMLLEEKLWWRVAGDRPYYESVPFHLLFLLLMGFLALTLVFRGLRAEGGALIQVRLPGGIQFTPSEFVRLSVAFFLADYLGRNSRVLRRLRQPLGSVWPLNRLHFERRAELGVLLVTVGLYCAFFYAFRDFGPAVIILVLTLAGLYAATNRLLTPVLLAGGFAAVVGFALQRHLIHTLDNRVAMWLDPWDTRFVNGDHLARILWSISGGGWFGLGPGTERLERMLPLAHNDAAFAGIAATMGMWVALALLGVFAAITWRGLVAAQQAPTDRMRLLGFTLTALLAIQAIWISGAMVRVFPFTGINVPFVSTGLSSMLASMIALGGIWNISRLTSQRPDATEATPEVLRGVRRLSRPLMLAFALPAAGTVLFGCPWLLADRTLMQRAVAKDYSGARVEIVSPLMARFRERFPRGRILSQDNRLLAVSNPNTADITALREVNSALADQAARVGPGVRIYPLGSAAAQLIGWNAQGRFQPMPGSVEAVWDPLLRGYDPDRLPSIFRWRHNPLIRPPEPQDIQLTLSTGTQRFAAERLARAVRESGASGGAVVAYDAASGAVLAAATAPAFDPNGLSLDRMTDYSMQDRKFGILHNKALTHDSIYFPGSAFKVVTAAAALEAGITGAVTCRRGRNAEELTWEYAGKRYRRPPGRIRDFAEGGHGSQSLGQGLDRALAASCNVFFARLATEVGTERLRSAMLRAELHHAPTADRLAEHLPYTGFGQIDIKVSPLEMAMLAGAVGMARADGLDVPAARPHWVAKVIAGGAELQPERLPGAPIIGKPYAPFSRETAERLRAMMIGVANSPGGTAYAAFHYGAQPRLPGITVGGKTGTAEFEKADGRIGRHAWFIGFARSDHELAPRTIAYAVLLEDVRRGFTGGRACAPVARDVIAEILPAPGRETPSPAGGLERFYQQQIRPRMGPLAPIIDWLRDRFTPRRSPGGP